MPEQDYIVVYEEEYDDSSPAEEDRLVLDVASRVGALQGSVDVETDVMVSSVDQPNHWGTIGVLVTLAGFIFAMGAVFYFSSAYPDAWYGADGVLDIGAQRGVLILAVLGSILLIGGNVLSYYGRSTEVRTTLHSLALVERISQSFPSDVVEAEVVGQA